jgi:hypothetical protein
MGVGTSHARCFGKILFYLCTIMKEQSHTPTENSKGAAIFKKMLEDKKAIHQHIVHGGKISDLKDKYKFANPVFIIGNK